MVKKSRKKSEVIEDSANSKNAAKPTAQPSDIDQAQDSTEIDDSSADLEERLNQALEEREDFEQKYVRAVAELQNMRKQSSNEVQNARKYAIDRFAGELLSVLESFDQANEASAATGKPAAQLDSIKEGLELTRKQLVGVLSKFSVEEIAVQTGDKFDPNLHEAIMMQPTSEVDANCVLTVVRKGFQIHDRLLRAAMVIVASAAPVEPPPDSKTESDGADGSEKA